MEGAGVISRIDKPIPWCAGMVVVPKSDSAVRICVDLKLLNENVLRETHPMPKVDDTSRCSQVQKSLASWMPIVDFGKFH